MNLNSCVNYAHFRKSGHIYQQYSDHVINPDIEILGSALAYTGPIL